MRPRAGRWSGPPVPPARRDEPVKGAVQVGDLDGEVTQAAGERGFGRVGGLDARDRALALDQLQPEAGLVHEHHAPEADLGYLEFVLGPEPECLGVPGRGRVQIRHVEAGVVPPERRSQRAVRLGRRCGGGIAHDRPLYLVGDNMSTVKQYDELESITIGG